MPKIRKQYIDVSAVFTKDGELIPKSIKWENGTDYEITKVLSIRPAASLKAGGAGTRYTCVICGQEKHLYYEDNNKWFVECFS